MKKITQIDRSTLGFIGLILAVILFLCVTIVSTFALKNYRVDFTDSQLFTLSKGSVQAVQEIKEPLLIRFYLSERLAKVSQEYVAYSIRVFELLEQYVSASNGKIKLEIVDPEPFSKNEDEAVAYGLKGIPVGDSSEYVYMGIVLTNSSDRKRVIALLDPSRERFLEYDITKYITDLVRTKRPTVGIISTLPIEGRGDPSLLYPKYHPRWAIMNQINDVFDTQFLSRQILDIPKEIDVLMLVNPKQFNNETLYAIDQYIMRGGNVLILIDPANETEILLGDSTLRSSPDLAHFFTSWGIGFETDKIVGDMNLARSITHTEDGKSVQIKYLPWLSVTDQYLSPEDPVTGALGTINLASSGFFRVTKKIPDVVATPLIFSSQQSGLFRATSVLDPNPVAMMREFKPVGRNFTLGLRLKGLFPSAFEQAPKRSFLQERTEPHLNKAIAPANIILIADSDFLADRFWVNKQNILGSEQVLPYAGNGDLVVNALDNLSGAVSLIQLRSKAEWRRPFTVLEDIALNAERNYRTQETALTVALETAQNRLKDLTTQTSKEDDAVLSQTDKQEIQELQHRILSIRGQLRLVQSVLTKDIRAMQTFIIFINVAFVPSLLIILAFFVAIHRKSKRSLKKG